MTLSHRFCCSLGEREGKALPWKVLEAQIVTEVEFRNIERNTANLNHNAIT